MRASVGTTGAVDLRFNNRKNLQRRPFNRTGFENRHAVQRRNARHSRNPTHSRDAAKNRCNRTQGASRLFSVAVLFCRASRPSCRRGRADRQVPTTSRRIPRKLSRDGTADRGQAELPEFRRTLATRGLSLRSDRRQRAAHRTCAFRCFINSSNRRRAMFHTRGLSGTSHGAPTAALVLARLVAAAALAAAVVVHLARMSAGRGAHAGPRTLVAAIGPFSATRVDAAANVRV